MRHEVVSSLVDMATGVHVDGLGVPCEDLGEVEIRHSQVFQFVAFLDQQGIPDFDRAAVGVFGGDRQPFFAVTHWLGARVVVVGLEEMVVARALFAAQAIEQRRAVGPDSGEVLVELVARGECTRRFGNEIYAKVMTCCGCFYPFRARFTTSSLPANAGDLSSSSPSRFEPFTAN